MYIVRGLKAERPRDEKGVSPEEAWNILRPANGCAFGHEALNGVVTPTGGLSLGALWKV